MGKITQRQRNELIEELIDDIVSACENDGQYLRSVVIDAMEYNARDDDELLGDYEDAFGRKFVEEEE